MRADPKSEHSVPSTLSGIQMYASYGNSSRKIEPLLPAWMRVLRHQQYGCFANTTFRCMVAAFEMPAAD
jgi:hypothetical protein